ncbi:YggS family pyridoxal phosphate-dependent enzyme [Salipaludibacillus sp. CF4.18]|uniref:YggS family pyridoxal phosphate-dependent enzyme n=1 Tax=Salipaludibacillus sp. CF4.18 TaxID=3373081 RepID=UPI003EE79719
MSVTENLTIIQDTIRAACARSNRNPDTVNLVAVTKYVSTERAQEAVSAGILHLGENRVEEGMEKWQVIDGDVNWHFIGNLQSRKVKNIIPAFHFIHSLDRLSLAKELDKRAEEGQTVKCFVQVNVTGEESKSGLTPAELPAFIEDVKQYTSVQIVGLMTMAPYTEDVETVRPAFKQLRELKEQIEQKEYIHAPCHELSMGMSNDYEVAIEEGATYIRIGTSLVGKEK